MAFVSRNRYQNPWFWYAKNIDLSLETGIWSLRIDYNTEIAMFWKNMRIKLDQNNENMYDYVCKYQMLIDFGGWTSINPSYFGVTRAPDEGPTTSRFGHITQLRCNSMARHAPGKHLAEKSNVLPLHT